jgi:hypothetical protein
MPSAKAGSPGPNVTQHCLKSRASWSNQNVAYSLYSRLLSPFTNVVVFFERDHGGLTPIFRILAHWIQLSPAAAGQWHRPHLVIYQTRQNSRSVKPDEEIAFEILEHYNPSKTLCFKYTKSAWKKCFASIVTLPQPTEQFPRDHILHQSVEVHRKKLAQSLLLKSTDFRRAFRAACQHFSRPEEEHLNLLNAYRPCERLCDALAFHIKEVAQAGDWTKEPPDTTIRLITSALLTATSVSGLRCKCVHPCVGICY